jgi:hypothetical protein
VLFLMAHCTGGGGVICASDGVPASG